MPYYMVFTLSYMFEDIRAFCRGDKSTCQVTKYSSKTAVLLAMVFFKKVTIDRLRGEITDKGRRCKESEILSSFNTAVSMTTPERSPPHYSKETRNGLPQQKKRKKRFKTNRFALQDLLFNRLQTNLLLKERKNITVS